ncbi:PREDICTED: probable peptidyl-tRNA hydrolase isoform X1 [Condylura cristata]|uniref:probable peptidyl-tRNA hydrolase isoform X1 n=1 Tax=Condylura cristata TaxID=143302 RepID=UPI0006432468|nr:PREDICTED: probable peptidyl-tRNA hydrolase isoform X1 [Condylura cristata]
MPPPGLLGAGLCLSRAMSRCVLEPRPPGKRWLVAGLGNAGLPGTRHSVGMAVLGQLARRLGVAESWARDRRCAADLALASLGDAQLVLLRPRRLMNANGRSVARAAELFGLTAEEVYLVHDELDKPLGKLALKLGGSARGHNGVRSCISCLNSSVSVPLCPAVVGMGQQGAPAPLTQSPGAPLALPQAMPRLRVGIGRPTHPEAVQAHVLGCFSPAEQELLPPLLERATDLLLDHIRARSQSPASGP